jgi:hypothetical protein
MGRAFRSCRAARRGSPCRWAQQDRHLSKAAAPSSNLRTFGRGIGSLRY